MEKLYIQVEKINSNHFSNFKIFPNFQKIRKTKNYLICSKIKKLIN